MNDPKKPSKLDRAVARAAAADTARIRADLDALGARAELAGMPARHVAAIRRAWDFMVLCAWTPADMRVQIDIIHGLVGDAEETRDAVRRTEKTDA